MSGLSRDTQLIVCVCFVAATILCAPTIYIIAVDTQFRLIVFATLFMLLWSLVVLFTIAEILLEATIDLAPMPPDGGHTLPTPVSSWPLPEGERPFSFLTRHPFPVQLPLHMRQSALFTKTRKEAPKDEVAKNAELLIRGGYIHKEMAGVYTLLPLGLRTFNNICRIVREEMDAIGGQELLMTVFQDKTLWEKTDRWDDAKVDNWFKTELKVGGTVGLGITHEEPVTRIMTDFIHSYRDLPVMAYQVQEKFRNETRAKSGIMRGREFFMKDMYSFARSDEEHKELYEKIKRAYKKIFERIGLGDRTFVTFAAGGIFSKYSEEFQTVSDAGEDLIYVDEERGIALNKEVYTDEVIADLGLDKAKLVERKAIETGNIFTLGTRFSEALGLLYKNEEGEDVPVVMGCYGLGPSRVMGTIVETLSDENGIVWPLEVAPFKIHVVQLGNDEAVVKAAEELYAALSASGIEVLYDDRDLRAGEKFADSDLLGMPFRAVVSAKTIADGKIEVVERATGEISKVTLEELASFVQR